mgnify:CR=1 FL=1
MKEMNIQFHKTRPQNPFDDGAKARLHRMGLLRIDGSVDEATLDALSRAYSGLTCATLARILVRSQRSFGDYMKLRSRPNHGKSFC